MENVDVKIVISLIAAFVSFVGLVITKEQKISEFRQNWIDSIRADIASLMGCLAQFSTEWLALKNNDNLDVRKGFLVKNVSILNEMHVLFFRIELRLNQEKDKELIDVLKSLDLMVKSPNKMNQAHRYDELTDKFKSKSHKMLKKEWTRVKKGELIFRISKAIFSVGSLFILWILFAEVGN